MKNESQVTEKTDADEIRGRVLTGLADNPSPGFHFPGYFLQLEWPRVGDDSIDETMPVGINMSSRRAATLKKRSAFSDTKNRGGPLVLREPPEKLSVVVARTYQSRRCRDSGTEPRGLPFRCHCKSAG